MITETEIAGVVPFVSRTLVDLVGSATVERTVDGALVFADISGFTPLTEQFDRRGREGSELLTDLLNSAFEPMLDVALGLGGDLLKFGGDALLLAFEGPDRSARAVSAAIEMQAVLDRVARRARVNLGMSVGVAAGRFRVAALGDGHPELLVWGPAVDQCLRLESAADQGQILVDPSLMDATGHQVAGDSQRAAPSAALRIDVPPIPEPPRRPPENPGCALIDPLVERAIEEGALPEHRRAVVGFVHFRIGDGPDAVAPAELRGLVEVVESACERFDVCLLNCDVDVGGGKFTLTAGVPTTTGDDADRLLLCALAIVEDPRAASVQIGINEGRCFAGPVGSPARRAYTVMGDPVNLAARVMAHARAGQVLATAEVIERTRQVFDASAVPPFNVKGKTSLIQALAVQGVTAEVAEVDTSAPTIGRDADIRSLGGRIDAALGGSGGVFELIGPPGIGKSRMVADLSAGRRVIRLECGRYLAQSPYGVIVEAARRWFGADAFSSERELAERIEPLVARLAPELVPWLPLAAVPFGVELPDTPETAALGEEFRVRWMHRVFLDLLMAMFPDPMLLTIEDTHWLDEATSALVSAGLDRLLEAGWVVLAARRDEPGGWRPGRGESVEVEPLDDLAAAALLERLTVRTPIPHHVSVRLIERARGNPLFLMELARAVRAGQLADELPDRVEVLIEARIDRLDIEARRLLRCASVLGARFERSLLASVFAGDLSLIDDLSEFLTEVAGEVRFTHALYRDTAYLTLPLRERRRLHWLAAEAIEDAAGDKATEFAEHLGVHWHLAGQPERALPLLLVAARRARADAAAAECAKFLEQALVCASRRGIASAAERSAIEEQLGTVYDTLGRFDDAERMFRGARRRSEDPARRAHLRGLEGRVARSARSLESAARRYRMALGEAPRDDPGVRAELLVGLASVLERQGRHADKIGLLEEAIEAAGAAGDRSTRAHGHLVLGNTYGDLGDSRGVEHLEEALRLFEAEGNSWGIASARNNLGVETYYAGDWNAALDHYQAALAAYQRLGDETNVAMAWNNIGEIHSDQGRYGEAGDEFDEARRVWVACGFKLGVALSTSNAGRLALRKGDHDRARAALLQARDGFRAIGAVGFELEAEVRLAELDLATGSLEDCVSRAEELLSRDSADLQPTVRCQLLRTAAVAAAGLGRRDRAAELLAESESVAAASGAAFEQAQCVLVGAELGFDDEPSRLEGAGATLARLGVVV